jgi:hypothetical protein
MRREVGRVGSMSLNVVYFGATVISKRGGGNRWDDMEMEMEMESGVDRLT